MSSASSKTPNVAGDVDEPARKLTGKTMLGVGWSVGTRLSNRLIDFVTLLVLARVLVPADFGLSALATTLVAVVDTVLEIALIQVLTRLPKIEKAHMDTAFTLGTLRGAAFAVIVLVSAWPFATVYHDMRLLPLIAALSIAPIARGLYSPGMVKFIREVSFRETFYIHLLSKIIAALAAIGVLYLGGGYWAIAANSIATAGAATLLSYAVAPYKPALSLVHLKEFTGFLSWFSLAQLVSAANWQSDRVLLGFYASKTDLGRYTVASDLATMPTQSLIGPAMQPVMAAFAQIYNDPERVRRAFLKAARFTMLLAMPACLFIACSADVLVQILFDEKWKAAAPYLQWAALTVLLNAYYQPLYSLAVAANKVRLLFELNLLDFGLRVVLFPIGLYYGHILGVLAARGVIAVIMFFAAVISARTLALVGFGAQLRNLWQVSASCVLFSAAVLALRHFTAPLALNAWIELALIVVVGGVTYLAALLAVGMRFAEILKLRE